MAMDPDNHNLIKRAQRQYDLYEMDRLPRALQRNSLDYYYLSVYPSIADLRPLGEAPEIPYPDAFHDVYIHTPFCSGICDFCSYFVLALRPRQQARIAAYLDLIRQEFEYHAARADLQIKTIYLGGGTPSLIPAAELDKLLAYMNGRGWLDPGLIGTIELHPEFFSDEKAAQRFLDVMAHYGLRRVSVGYQFSEEQMLADNNRRHDSGFIEAAISLLRGRGFLVNLDLMYGLADQTLAGWARTLNTAVALAPDSISTYFLFVDRGTLTYREVQAGKIVLPDHRYLQTQHLMAQLFLVESGYYELPNDFYARNVAQPETFIQERLPSAAVKLPVGPGAYGYYNGTQLCNVFDLVQYEQRIAGGRSPLWRATNLTADEAFRRDIMFSLKNEPFLDCSLFANHYNKSPLVVFSGPFEVLQRFGLIEQTGDRIWLTAKGRLCVEEICWLFHDPLANSSMNLTAAERRKLEKHRYAPAYPGLEDQHAPTRYAVQKEIT